MHLCCAAADRGQDAVHCNSVVHPMAAPLPPFPQCIELRALLEQGNSSCRGGGYPSLEVPEAVDGALGSLSWGGTQPTVPSHPTVL